MGLSLSPGSILVLGIADIEAQAGPCTDIFPEHVFLAVCKACDLEDGSLKELAEAIGVPFSAVQDEVSVLRKLFNGADVDTTRTRRRLRKLLRDSPAHNGPFSGHRSESCRRIYRRSEGIAVADGGKEVAVHHVLLAFREENVPLVLSALADTKGIWTSLDRLIPREARVGSAGCADDSGGKHSMKAAKENPSRTPILDEFGRDLTALAKSGRLAPCVGRKNEIRAVAQVLLRQTKNNPVLVGDPGVGKTCIVEGLALRVVAPNASSVMRDWRIVEISVADLIAGCIYRGQFEERLRKTIDEAQKDRNVILFMDELHILAGAGGGSDRGMDAGQILKPALGRGDIRLIGATTTAEYRKYIEPDAALERRFQLVWVNEPSREEAIEILEGLRSGIEAHHGIVLQPAVLEKAVEWSMRYLPDHRLPDKAIDIIDQACATRILQTLSSQKRPSQDEVRSAPRTPQALSIDDIAKVVSARCRVPVGAVSEDETAKLMHLEVALSERVFGQEAAVKEVAEAVRTARAGLKKANRPIGVFLFLGSTGIGKTELARALAQSLFGADDALIRFDMSEFSEKHNVARLIGAPPGYIGYGEEGQLTGKVRTRPYSVVLFDEVEKADPSVFDIFLQVFDEGQLTDGTGRRALFAESVIILTSNLGTSSDDQPRRVIGIHREDEESISLEAYRRTIEQAVQKAFRPELLNRISHKIVFSPLTKAVMLQILDKLIAQLSMMLNDKGLSVEFSDQARDFLLQEGHWDVYGARELDRTFEKLITTPLAKEILERKNDTGAKIRVVLGKGQLDFLRGDEISQ